MRYVERVVSRFGYRIVERHYTCARCKKDGGVKEVSKTKM